MGKIKTAYEALGNNKGQRFRRAFSILFLIAVLIGYGFYSKSIHISVNKVFGNGPSAMEEKP